MPFNLLPENKTSHNHGYIRGNIETGYQTQINILIQIWIVITSIRILTLVKLFFRSGFSIILQLFAKKNGSATGHDLHRYQFNDNLHFYKVFFTALSLIYIFCIFCIINNSRNGRRMSKSLINSKKEEVNHENFRVHNPFLQLPGDECKKKIRSGTMNSSSANSSTISMT